MRLVSMPAVPEDTYKVGTVRVESFVALADVRAHLRLLHAFAELRGRVYGAARRAQPPAYGTEAQPAATPAYSGDSKLDCELAGSSKHLDGLPPAGFVQTAAPLDAGQSTGSATLPPAGFPETAAASTDASSSKGPAISTQAGSSKLAAAPSYAKAQAAPSETGSSSLREPPARPDAEPRVHEAWANYLRRAAHRLELYLERILLAPDAGLNPPPKATRISELRPGSARPLVGALPPHCMPPLDVLLVWHAYCLSPGAYYDDLLRLRSRIALGSVEFPLHAAARSLDPQTWLSVLPEGEDFWVRHVQEPWALGLIAPVYEPKGLETSEMGKAITCPSCEASIFVPWGASAHAPGAKGLGDADWSVPCPDCSRLLNVQVLRGAVFIRDLERWCNSPTAPTRGLAFSALDGREFTYDLATAVFAPLFRHVQRPGDDWFALSQANSHGKRGIYLDQDPRAWAERHNWSLPSMLASVSEDSDRVRNFELVAGARSKFNRRISYIFRAYLEADPLVECSVDLALAVQRQFAFVEEMGKLGWSSPAALDAGTHDVDCARAIVRYHNWLDLMSDGPVTLCPTLDVDLCWHTHMLFGRRYAQNVYHALRRFIDHDDRISDDVLSGAFEHTAKLWQKKYSQPYSLCGCLKPEATKTRRISSLFGGSKGKALPERTEQASHPSEHNGVILTDDDGTSRERFERRQHLQRQGTAHPEHDAAFQRGYGATPLMPFYYVPASPDGLGPCVGHQGDAWQIGHGACCGGASILSSCTSAAYAGAAGGVGGGVPYNARAGAGSRALAGGAFAGSGAACGGGGAGGGF